MRRALLLLLLPVAATIASCLGATEIELTITTNACTDLQRLDVYVGKNGSQLAVPTTSVPAQCEDEASTSGTIGTLSIVPSGAPNESIALAVVAALNGGVCAKPVSEPKCIVARRALSFSPHQRLDLPIFLDTACANAPCTDTQTCVVQNGVPVCLDQKCDVTGGVPCAITDASTKDVNGIDAFAVCKPPIPVDSGKPTLRWSFDLNQTDNMVHEDSDLVAPSPLAPTSSFAFVNGVCNRYLKTGNIDQSISGASTIFQTTSFTIGFYFRATGDGSLVHLAPKTANTGGFKIAIQGGVITVVMDGVQAIQVLTDTVPVADGTWHSFSMSVATSTGPSTIQFVRDGIGVAPTASATYVPASESLTVGPIDGIDEVEFFSR